VTEYLLRVFGGGGNIEGLLYSSALNGTVCTVLDVKNDRCIEQDPGWEDSEDLVLALDRESIQTGPVV
jgi:hypothetical protein